MRGYGGIGQSNQGGIADWSQNPSPPAPATLLKLRYYQNDLFDRVDDSGTLTPLVFDPALIDTPTSSFDYLPTIGQPFYFALPALLFGPEVYAGLAMLDHLGGPDIIIVKLGPGGVYVRDNGLLNDQDRVSWFVPSAHRSWDPALPRDASPWVETVSDSGIATATTASSLTDATKSWAVNEHIGHYVTIGTREARIIANGATVLNFFFWNPPGGGTPAPAAYTITKRAMFPASLARSFVEGYCEGAMAAAVGIGDTLDMRAINVALGENDAQQMRTALLYKKGLLTLMWYIRNELVARGLTTLQAERVAFALCDVKLTTGVGAPLINQANREIGRGDPWAREIEVSDVEVGGLVGGDNLHYNALGQIRLGTKVGAAFVDFDIINQPRARASIEMSAQHVALTPIYGVGSGSVEWYTLLLGAVPVDKRRYPSFYLLRDAETGSAPVYMNKDGTVLSRLSLPNAELIGYASPSAEHGEVDVASLSIQSASSRRPHRGTSPGTVARGFAWVGADGTSDIFREREVVVSSAGQSHTLFASDAQADRVTRWRTTVPGVVTDREWMLRGFNGAMSLQGKLIVREKLGYDLVPWMTHQLTTGDHVQAQTVSQGAHLSPRISTIGNGRIGGEVLALDWGCNNQTPLDRALSGPVTADTLLEVDHGAASDGAVIWQGAVLGHEVTPNWRGIEGVFKVVHSVTTDFDVSPDHELEFESTLWLDYLSGFDDQFAYDPDTAVVAALGFNPAVNNIHRFGAQTRDVYDPAGALVGPAAPLLSRARGVVGWFEVGTAFAVGVYVSMVPPSIAGLFRTSAAVAGNRAIGPPPNYPGFASYDQLDFTYLRQIQATAGNSLGLVSGRPARWATFILVGSIAQVVAAADQLRTLGVDATWVDR